MPDSLVGKADNRFLYFALRFARLALKALAPQMAQANLSLNLLSPFEIPLPPLDTQQRLATELDVALREAESLRERLVIKFADVEKLSTALLCEAFSGSVD